jgi:hypothetical protein
VVRLRISWWYTSSSTLHRASRCASVEHPSANTTQVSGLLHDQDRPEADLATFHVLEGLVHFLQRELLNHALDTMRFRKRNRLFAIQCVARRPSVNAQPIINQRWSANRDIANDGKCQQLASRLQPIEQRRDNLGVGRSDRDERSTSQLLQLLSHVGSLGIDVIGRAEFHGKLLLAGPTRKSNGTETHLPAVLDRKMSQTTQALHGDDFASRDIHPPNAVEHGHAGTEQWSRFSCINAFRDADACFGSYGGVLSISAFAKHSVDCLVVAELELTAIACATFEVVAAVPWPADTVADFPFGFAVADGYYFADVLVAEAFDLAGIESQFRVLMW